MPLVRPSGPAFSRTEGDTKCRRLIRVTLSLSKGDARRKFSDMPSWVYIFRCSDESYYTGVTSNIERRLDQHYHGEVGYTASRKPFEFLWSAEFAHIDDAIAFEKQVKGWSRAKKEALMRDDWSEVQRLACTKGSAWRRPSTGSG